MPSDGRYYAVDVYVQDNTGQTWTLTHTRQSLKSGTNTLDNNVNVTFAKQGSESGVDLSKVSFANSNNKAYTKTDLGTGNHLRIYYGLATGSKDAPGASPIGINQPAGTYTGSVTITLTP
jgi:hypothetical protein